jgi:hypothetical protein
MKFESLQYPEGKLKHLCGFDCAVSLNVIIGFDGLSNVQAV